MFKLTLSQIPLIIPGRTGTDRATAISDTALSTRTRYRAAVLHSLAIDCCFVCKAEVRVGSARRVRGAGIRFRCRHSEPRSRSCATPTHAEAALGPTSLMPGQRGMHAALSVPRAGLRVNSEVNPVCPLPSRPPSRHLSRTTTREISSSTERISCLSAVQLRLRLPPKQKKPTIETSRNSSHNSRVSTIHPSHKHQPGTESSVDRDIAPNNARHSRHSLRSGR
jgi:hypothetical protein